jgi:hypothetical protein
VNRRLWRGCRRAVARLHLPIPFDTNDFIEALARARGRPIELAPIVAHAGIPCGMLLTTDRADYIFYPTNTTPLHAQHVVLHEIGHLVREHTGTSGPAATLFPNLPADLVRRVLGRTVYTEREEQEAELIASLILHRAVLRGGTVSPPVARLRWLLTGRPSDD